MASNEAEDDFAGKFVFNNNYLRVIANFSKLRSIITASKRKFAMIYLKLVFDMC